MRVASVAICTLLFLSLTVPTAYSEIKVCLILISTVALAYSFLTRKMHISRSLLLGILFVSGLGLSFSIYGYINGNPGAIRVLTLWLVWPAFYLFVSSLLVQYSAFLTIMRIFSAALLCVVLYSYYYLAYSVGIVPEYLYVGLDQGQAVGFHDGYIEYELHSIASLIFLLPLYVHYKFELYKRSETVTLFSILTIAAAMSLAIFTGRKVLILLLFLLPLFVFASNKFLGNRVLFRPGVKTLSLAGFFAATVSVVLSNSGLVFDSFLEMFLAGFDFLDGDAGARDRRLMFVALIEGWIATSILFGAGNGAVADFVSSPEMPWAYELTYVYLLFTTGVVGVFLLFAWYAYAVMKLRRATLDRPDLVVYTAPMLTGSVMFCIAAATNPYFSKFDYLWIVHLPLIVSVWARYQAERTSR